MTTTRTTIGEQLFQPEGYPDDFAASQPAARRKSVKTRAVGRLPDGPISLVRIHYTDGRRTWGVSVPGGLMLFGSDRLAPKLYTRAMLAHYARPLHVRQQILEPTGHSAVLAADRVRTAR